MCPPPRSTDFLLGDGEVPLLCVLLPAALSSCWVGRKATLTWCLKTGRRRGPFILPALAPYRHAPVSVLE